MSRGRIGLCRIERDCCEGFCRQCGQICIWYSTVLYLKLFVFCGKFGQVARQLGLHPMTGFYAWDAGLPAIRDFFGHNDVNKVRYNKPHTIGGAGQRMQRIVGPGAFQDASASSSPDASASPQKKVKPEIWLSEAASQLDWDMMQAIGRDKRCLILDTRGQLTDRDQDRRADQFSKMGPVEYKTFFPDLPPNFTKKGFLTNGLMNKNRHNDDLKNWKLVKGVLGELLDYLKPDSEVDVIIVVCRQAANRSPAVVGAAILMLSGDPDPGAVDSIVAFLREVRSIVDVDSTESHDRGEHLTGRQFLKAVQPWIAREAQRQGTRREGFNLTWLSIDAYRDRVRTWLETNVKATATTSAKPPPGEAATSPPAKAAASGRSKKQVSNAKPSSDASASDGSASQGNPLDASASEGQNGETEAKATKIPERKEKEDEEEDENKEPEEQLGEEADWGTTGDPSPPTQDQPPESKAVKKKKGGSHGDRFPEQLPSAFSQGSLQGACMHCALDERNTLLYIVHSCSTVSYSTAR